MKNLFLSLLCVLFTLSNNQLFSQQSRWDDASKRTFLTEKSFKKYYFKFVDNDHLEVIKQGQEWIDEDEYPDDFRIPVLMSLSYLEIYEEYDYELMRVLGIRSSEEWLCLYRSWQYLNIAKAINENSFYDFTEQSKFNGVRDLIRYTSKNINGLVFVINDYSDLKDQLLDLSSTILSVSENDINTKINLMSLYTIIGDTELRNKEYNELVSNIKDYDKRFMDLKSLENTTLNYLYISEEYGTNDLNNHLIPTIMKFLPNSFDIYSYRVITE